MWVQIPPRWIAIYKESKDPGHSCIRVFKKGKRQPIVEIPVINVDGDLHIRQAYEGRHRAMLYHGRGTRAIPFKTGETYPVQDIELIMFNGVQAHKIYIN